ncbi:hypothetical protein [Psychrobacter pocilloporae]|uniref:Uncharacterized protein n=1 Tax=Psychrobacter pocilloporae TaxID=1775882 RepID=A0ABT6ITP4_9GAMM|nr:hypothetical protein [Psychrobacter pocilloporae]MDH4905093.1 hypothetical protein [Psychrobacter pocilloporae]
MFWLGFGITAVGAIACALASMFEQDSLTESQQALSHLKKERQSRQRELEDYQRQCQAASSLSQYVALYRLVSQAAQACASQYEEQEQLLFMLNERMTKSITTRLALMRQQDQACDDQKRTLDQQFAIVQDDAKKALEEFERVEAQRQETEQQLRIFCDLIQQLQAYLE